MNESTVREVIQEVAGDEPDDITEYDDGVNSVYNVAVGEKTVVVKFGTFDSSSVRVEPYVLRWLAERGLPTPTVYHIGEHAGIPFFVMEELAGTQYRYAPELDIDEVASAARTIGSLLAQAHGDEIGVGPLVVADGSLVTENVDWEPFFTRYMSRFIEQAKQNYPTLGSEAARLSHWATIPSADGGYFCPLDMHTRNVFIEDGTVTGVMDFERCFGGHSAWGYATTLHTIRAGRTGRNGERIEHEFRRGYERHRDAPDIAPVFELAALLREMRAAHMWWDNPDDERNRLQATFDEIERRIQQNSP